MEYLHKVMSLLPEGTTSVYVQGDRGRLKPFVALFRVMGVYRSWREGRSLINLSTEHMVRCSMLKYFTVAAAYHIVMEMVRMVSIIEV